MRTNGMPSISILWSKQRMFQGRKGINQVELIPWSHQSTPCFYQCITVPGDKPDSCCWTWRPGGPHLASLTCETGPGTPSGYTITPGPDAADWGNLPVNSPCLDLKLQTKLEHVRVEGNSQWSYKRVKGWPRSKQRSNIRASVSSPLGCTLPAALELIVDCELKAPRTAELCQGDFNPTNQSNTPSTIPFLPFVGGAWAGVIPYHSFTSKASILNGWT